MKIELDLEPSDILVLAALLLSGCTTVPKDMPEYLAEAKAVSMKITLACKKAVLQQQTQEQ